LRLSLLHINYHHFSDKFRLFQSQSSDEKPSEFVCFPPDARNKRILIVEGEFPQKSFLSFFTTFAPLCSSQVLLSIEDHEIVKDCLHFYSNNQYPMNLFINY